MSTLIVNSESFDRVVYLYLDKIFGNRHKHVNKTAKYIFWLDSNNKFLFEYIDEGFGVGESIYIKFGNIFGLSHWMIYKYLTHWFKENMSDYEFTEIYATEDDDY